jgi:thymidylate synthase
MRIYQNLYECAKETQRDLHEMGIQVKLKTFQNKNVENDESRSITKELQGYTFKILNPFEEKSLLDAYKLVYGDNADIQLRWCIEEFNERIKPNPGASLSIYSEPFQFESSVNPGQAWLLRKNTWTQFLNEEGKFDYNYNERLLIHDQLPRIINHLRSDINSRRAVISIWDSFQDLEGLEQCLRVPCSVTYSFLYREGKLNIFYHMRSSDFYEHFLNDMYLASKMNLYVAQELGVEIGDTVVYVNSLHAYKIDLDKRGIF